MKTQSRLSWFCYKRAFPSLQLINEERIRSSPKIHTYCRKLNWKHISLLLCNRHVSVYMCGNTRSEQKCPSSILRNFFITITKHFSRNYYHNNNSSSNANNNLWQRRNCLFHFFNCKHACSQKNQKVLQHRLNLIYTINNSSYVFEFLLTACTDKTISLL